MAKSSGRVMLVVPNYVERMGLREVIESCPRYQLVAEACLAQTALDMATETKPDIAVVEYWLTDATGLVLSHKLTHDHPRMGVLLYSDRISDEWIADALREGVRGFVTKDGIARHLVPALDALFDHRPYWDEAVDEKLFTRLIGGPPSPPNGLTNREWQVVHLVTQGLSNKQIANVLDIPTETVEKS